MSGDQGAARCITIDRRKVSACKALPPGKGGLPRHVSEPRRKPPIRLRSHKRRSCRRIDRNRQAFGAALRDLVLTTGPGAKLDLAKSPAPLAPAESCKAASVHVIHAGTHTTINVFHMHEGGGEECAALVEGLASPQMRVR
jgi:hypothetical protein